MDKDKLKEILKLHKMWVLGKERGYRADLSRANLYGANLYRANLSRANLSGADLYRANLSGANLYRADLSGANLCGANLCGANLSGANLCGANLSGADLYGANLYGADLYGADLKEGLKIKSKKFSYYQGSDYYCLFFGSIIKIGCEAHYCKEWESFDNDRIFGMDDYRSLEFWKREKNIIISISKHLTNSRSLK